MMQKGWQRIYFSTKPHLTEIAKAILEEKNIECVIIDKRDSSYITIGELELYVKDTDVIPAKHELSKNNL
jgi:hypothetical protein